MIQPDFKKQISLLLEKSQITTEVLSLKHCMNGANNRGYLLETREGRFFVKQYFRQQGDERDRLKAEFAFLSYAKKAAPRFVPCSYGQDEENGLALYEYVEGRAFTSADVGKQEIREAAAFFCALNHLAMKQEAMNLPSASEAGFSIQDHINNVSLRIDKLQQALDEKEQEAKCFIQALQAHWQILLAKIKQQAEEQGLDLQTPLPLSERCISPSDFGFHNALKMTDGRVCFLDFEYAGWDDPAKMVGDFFLQLAIPIPSQYHELFLGEVFIPFPQLASLIQRAKLLQALCRVKWCCIALNVYIPVHLARRQFANPGLNTVELKQNQLKKAKQILNLTHT